MASNAATVVEVEELSHDEVSAHEESAAAKDNTSGVSAPSLLSRLKPPDETKLSRKRAIETRTSKKGSFKPPNVKYEPKSKGPKVRVAQFPGEYLCTRSGKLYCDACRHELSTVKAIITQHIASTKHKENKSKVTETARENSQLLIDSCNFQKKTSSVGATLPDDVVVYRTKCLRVCMKAGIPLKKIDDLRPLLEEHGHCLTGSQHLGDLIPMIQESEREYVLKQITGKDISIIFDGTTTVCEAFALVIRFVEKDFSVHQVLARLQLAAKSLSGQQVAHILLYTLSNIYRVEPSHLIAAMRDRASVNDVGIRSILPLYDQMLDVSCFSHTLDHVGGKVESEELDAFVSSWVQLFSHSPKSRLEWKSLTGVNMRSYSKTRWWSKFEVMVQLHDLFGDVVTFLQTHVETPGAIRSRLRRKVEDLQLRGQIQMELAVTVEFSRPFVQATYNLEGDGPLCLIAYDTVSSLIHFVTNPHLPSTKALAQRLGGGNEQHQQAWLNFAEARLPAPTEYFRARFAEGGILWPLVQAFKAARLLDPRKVRDMVPTLDAVDDLQAFPFIGGAEIEQMKAELPRYIAACEDVADVCDPLVWWKNHSDDHPTWSTIFRKILLVQPSSAAAERVFSILQSSFSKLQESSLEDYVESSVMLQYNNRK